MSHYGYGYGPPQGYQPPQSFSYQPQQFYPFASYPPTENVDSYHIGSGPAVDEYNQIGIPGLGLSTNMNMVWQHDLVTDPHGVSLQPLQPVTDGRMLNQGRVADHAVHKSQRSGKRDVDAMEEGELSEGELEDIYEPGGMEGAFALPPRPPNIGRSSNPAVHEGSVGMNFHHVVHPNSRDPVDDPLSGHLETYDRLRRRSRSYSPYLSPSEPRSDGRSNSGPNADEIAQMYSRSERNNNLSNQPSKMTSPGGIDHQGSLQPSAEVTLAEAREQAQDAIRRLWPLNVRFQNYVNEGIDKAILNDLFVDLGLSSDVTMQDREQVAGAAQIQSKPPPHVAEQKSDQQTLQTAPETTEAPDKPKNKAEERKDRIARLLAAKGSKASAGTSLPNNTKPALGTQVAAVPSKTQSEKSKLLQQKMEALKKAREETAKKAAQEQASAAPNTAVMVSQSLAAPASSGSNGTTTNETPVPVEQRTQPASPTEKVDAQATQPIPGLFLSSIPQPTQPINPRKRPVAADLNDALSMSSYKRPFGQIRESGPFLIDVSDDEDDAEMEIDSPEQRSPVVQVTTPAVRPSSFRDHPALSDNGVSRQCSSPSAIATPTGPVVHTNSLYDLESMNKKIEDMKRKIAEAEARKKAKQSQNGTPSLPLSQVQSKEGSVDPLSNTRPPLIRAETTDNRTFTSLPQETPGTALKVPKGPIRSQHTNNLIRSRIASERLPLLEARRRSQMAQLRELQSQVTRIEKEIQDSLDEEKRLREEVKLSESASDDTQLPPRSESVPGGNNSGSTSLETTRDLQATTIQASEKPDVQHSQPTASTSLILPPAANEDLTTGATNVHASLESSILDQGSGSPSSRIENEDPSVAEDQEMGEAFEKNTDEGFSPVDPVATPSAAEEPLATSGIGATNPDDLTSDSARELDLDRDPEVAMEDVEDSSSSDDISDASDDYEPAEPEIEQPRESSSPLSQSPPHKSVVLETDEADDQGVSTATPITELISTAKEDSVPGSAREVDTVQVTTPPEPRTSYVPYDTPLRYFHAYRFHPNFQQTVIGGLRSLTYSNMIDAKQPVCPDQLLAAECPRGSECGFQHFEQMKAPDDQILLQLGAYGNYEEEQKQRYISGLRDLLTDFRNREVRDFQSISQGIIDYRAQFHGDKTKVLPLGSVSI